MEKAQNGVKSGKSNGWGRVKTYIGKLSRQERLDLANDIVARKNRKNRREAAEDMQANLSDKDKLARLDRIHGEGVGCTKERAKIAKRS